LPLSRPPGLNIVVEKPAGNASDSVGQKDISVLLVGNRLQITADVHDRGLAKLKDVLSKYEEILKMLQ